jgi:hypothetical protein
MPTCPQRHDNRLGGASPAPTPCKLRWPPPYRLCPRSRDQHSQGQAAVEEPHPGESHQRLHCTHTPPRQRRHHRGVWAGAGHVPTAGRAPRGTQTQQTGPRPGPWRRRQAARCSASAPLQHGSQGQQHKHRTERGGELGAGVTTHPRPRGAKVPKRAALIHHTQGDTVSMPRHPPPPPCALSEHTRGSDTLAC